MQRNLLILQFVAVALHVAVGVPKPCQLKGKKLKNCVLTITSTTVIPKSIKGSRVTIRCNADPCIIVPIGMSLTLVKSTITGSHTGTFTGTCIGAYGDVTLAYTTVSNCGKPGAEIGSAIVGNGPSEIMIYASKLVGNKGNHGGAIAVGNLAQLKLVNSNISGNEADFGAGVMAVDASSVAIFNNEFSSNKATDKSSIIHLVESKAVVIGNKFKNNESAGGNPNEAVKCQRYSILRPAFVLQFKDNNLNNTAVDVNGGSCILATY